MIVVPTTSPLSLAADDVAGVMAGWRPCAGPEAGGNGAAAHTDRGAVSEPCGPAVVTQPPLIEPAHLVSFLARGGGTGRTQFVQSEPQTYIDLIYIYIYRIYSSTLSLMRYHNVIVVNLL